MEFTATLLLSQFRHTARTFTDTRIGENTHYSIEDIAAGAFSVFFTQCPSFLAYQRHMEAASGRSNAGSLFAIEAIPSDNQIREILDGVSPSEISPLFRWCFDQAVAGGLMADFKTELGMLIALDGTQYFSSETIHCKNCLTKTDKKTQHVTYSHTAITPVIVKPKEDHVFPLPPEFIVPQDGAVKQDCEIAAAKRFIASVGPQLTGMEGMAETDKPTLLGDDLYSHEPFAKTVLAQGFNFIFVCKPESHKTLYAWINGITEEYIEDRFDGKKHHIYTYRYAKGVPLREPLNKRDDVLLVNFVEITVTDRSTGKHLYHNAFITPYQLTTESLPLIVDCGRARWKVENENNNTLKTKGYYFEHNYGHGEKYLAATLTTLILLAFLFHTLLDMTCAAYMLLVGKMKRQFFFSSIQTLTQFFYVPSWEYLFASMKRGLEELLPLPTTPFATLPSG